MITKSFQERLASLVKSHGSVRSFAKHAELSQAVMVKYINGESTPNLPRLLSIAKALNVRLGWLASGSGTKDAEGDYFDKVRLDQFPERLNQVAGANPRNFSSTSNLSITGITKYLNGESTPNVERLISLAEAGGVSVEWLATGIEEMNSEEQQNESGSKHETQANVQTLLHRKFLKYLDKIELTGEHKVYADVPCHFVKANRRGDFSLTNHAVTLIDNFDYLQGTYFVANTEMTGGDKERGIPDGYKVTCTRLDGKYTVSFFQSGDFPAVIKNITPTE